MEYSWDFLRDPAAQLNKITGISAGFCSELLASLGYIALLWAVRWLLVKVIWSRTQDVHIRYQCRKVSSYGVWVLTLFLVVRLWFNQFSNAATFFGCCRRGWRSPSRTRWST